MGCQRRLLQIVLLWIFLLSEVPDIIVSKSIPGDYSPCIDSASDCSYVEAGNYQSCRTCRGYIACSAGNVFYNMTCPANLVWDDGLKRCDRKSTTCSLYQNAKGKSILPGGCEVSCQGLDDGSYPSCMACNKYVTCSNGVTYADRLCPGNLVWDSDLKQCLGSTNTCGTVVRACERNRHAPNAPELKISCEKDQKIIIHWAVYGRVSRDPTICPYPLPLRHKNILCKNNAEFAKTVVEGFCKGKNSCSVLPSNSIFGEPCITNYKYLSVNYSCLPGWIYDLREQK